MKQIKCAVLEWCFFNVKEKVCHIKMFQDNVLKGIQYIQVLIAEKKFNRQPDTKTLKSCILRQSFYKATCHKTKNSEG